VLLAALSSLAFASTASAATLSVSVEEVRYKGEWKVTVSGQADKPSSVQLYVGDADKPCDPFANEGANGPMTEVPAGAFSKTVEVVNSSGRDIGIRHAACAFLFEQGYSTVVASASAPVASDPPKKTIRANTNNLLDTSASGRRGLSTWQMGCGGGTVNECDLRGRGRITVSAATRQRLKLPSAVIAKGTIRDNGERSWLLSFDASKAVGQRLRKAASVPVVFELTLEEPFARTITFATKMLVRKTPSHTPSGLRPLYLDWDETGKRLSRGGGGRG
jgi:hypothetical protein